MTSMLFRGWLSHLRKQPVVHRFIYRHQFFAVNIDELTDLDQQNLVAYNRFGALSIYDKDYGDGSAQGLRPFIDQLLQQHNLHSDRVMLITCLRCFGYAFNPLSIWLCYNNNAVVATVYEVHNTFGERHHYFIKESLGDDREQQSTQSWPLRHLANKEFYVSPFMAMDCEYRFRLCLDKEQFHLAIKQSQANQPVFSAAWSGQGVDLASQLPWQVASRGLYNNFRVIIGIHWQALKLWFKKVPLVKREKISVAGQNQTKKASLANQLASANRIRSEG